ncbi:MAG: hypothetical protein COV45_04980 [Deltaproteobacteria bacterium CG11_big_fil_rev_8_21_14_0_20_47_16]|nr:MAG: hypothetical protein COV45_04980 [Deltaproteobacteria bacterium CG11_big_fil_rev_8_21_14_0_20_47_16]
MKRLTVSELETYSRCPMEYRLKYTMNVPSQSLPTSDNNQLAGNVLGDVVHACICSQLLYPKLSLDQIIQRHLIDRDIMRVVSEQNDIKEMCQRAIHFHKERSWINFQTEVPFVLQLGENTINGTIDFIGQDSEGWHIVDYKTDRLASHKDIPERAKSYELQMMAYAIAAQKSELAPIKDVTLLFLRLNQSVLFPITEQVMTTAQLQIREVATAIGIPNAASTKAPPCRTCPYHHNHMCWEDRLKTA